MPLTLLDNVSQVFKIQRVIMYSFFLHIKVDVNFRNFWDGVQKDDHILKNITIFVYFEIALPTFITMFMVKKKILSER